MNHEQQLKDLAVRFTSRKVMRECLGEHRPSETCKECEHEDGVLVEIGGVEKMKILDEAEAICKEHNLGDYEEVFYGYCEEVDQYKHLVLKQSRKPFLLPNGMTLSKGKIVG